jgi:hypothetical protein
MMATAKSNCITSMGRRTGSSFAQFAKAVPARAAGFALVACTLPAFATYNPPPACNNPFTPQQEITEGNKVAAQVYQQMPVLPDSDPVARYVAQLGAHLAEHAPGAKWPYSFHVVASPDINAFALPGGAIFVNLGTVQAAETEAQLAGVIAHETSHVVMRHATCNMKKQQTKGIEYGLGSILSQIFIKGTAGQVVAAGLQGLQGLDYLRMSRDDEKQADLLGTDTLYNAGYDPRGLPQFFEIIQSKYGAGGAQILTDHPNPGNRTEYVNAEIATLPRNPNAMVTSAAFQRVRQQAQGERTFTTQQVSAGAWKNGYYASGPNQGGGNVYNAQNGQRNGTDGRSTNGQGGQYGNGQNGQYGNGQNQNGQNGQYGDGQNRDSQNGQNQNNQYGAGGPVPLTPGQVGVGGRLTRYQGQNFTLNIPQRWQTAAGENGGVTFAPVGGSGAFGVSYGAIVGAATDGQNAITDGDALSSATIALAQQLSQANGGLQQTSGTTSISVNGQAGMALELRGRSPLVENGNTISERDWLITVAAPDGDMHYIVFVCPERDFNRLRPLFVAMINSFHPQ